MAIKRDNVVKLLRELEYEPIIDSEMDALYEVWNQWYKGSVDGFHEYTIHQGKSYKQTVKRYTANIWKSVCERWADNQWNPETKAVLEEKTQIWWDNLSQELNFDKYMNNLQEKRFALGTQATVEYLDHNGKPKIDYLDYGNIFILGTELEEVTDVVFASEYQSGVVYLAFHLLNDDGTYTILNRFYKSDNEGNLTELPVGSLLIEEGLITEYVVPVKLFQIHKPAIVNNLVQGSPYGISVLANAIDEVKATDIAYDALTKEPLHGKIRLYLRDGALDFDNDGKGTVPFNGGGEEFYILQGDDTNDEGELVTVSTPQLREILTDFYNVQRNAVGSKAGLGDKAFFDEGNSIYTNTAQVISTNSDFFKTRQKHGVEMESNVVSIIKALYWLEHGNELDEAISVQMDDSIIHDKEDELKQDMQLFNADIVSKVYIVQRRMNLTLEEAKNFIKEQNELKGLEEVIDLE